LRIRFSAYRVPPPWFADAMKEGRLAIRQAGEPAIMNVPLWKSSDASGQWGSCIVIDITKECSIEVVEWRKWEARSASRRAIENVITEVGNAMAMSKDVDSGDFWRKALPSGAVAEKMCLIVDATSWPHEYRIHGFINGGERGIVTVRVFDPDTDEVIGEMVASMRRSEYVGWSGDKDVFFPFECTYYESETGKEKPVRFEAWFYPRGSSGRRMITTIKPGVRVFRK